jgi:predicted secreted protein
VNWFTGLLPYLCIWWLVLFTVLPWGDQPPKTPGPGHAPSAPAKPRLALKFLVTTGISAVIFLIVLAIVTYSPITFRE